MQNISELSNDQIKAETTKILERRAKQRERMKTRSKAKRAYERELLAAAEAKNLLPTNGAPAAKRSK